MSLGTEELIKKREEQLVVVNQLATSLNEKQQEANGLSQSLTLNQGALYQLNALLEEMGVDLSTLGQEEAPAAGETADGAEEGAA